MHSDSVVRLPNNSSPFWHTFSSKRECDKTREDCSSGWKGRGYVKLLTIVQNTDVNKINAPAKNSCQTVSTRLVRSNRDVDWSGAILRAGGWVTVQSKRHIIVCDIVFSCPKVILKKGTESNAWAEKPEFTNYTVPLLSQCGVTHRIIPKLWEASHLIQAFEQQLSTYDEI